MAGISKITINGEELTLNATNDGNGNEIAGTYLPLTGGTLSGNLRINGSSSGATNFIVSRPDTGTAIYLDISTSGLSRGLWQVDKNGNSGWLLYQTEANNVYLRASDGTNTSSLYLSPSGSLTFGGDEVVRVAANAFAAETSGNSGYCKFNNGLLIQWCGSTATTSGATVTWPAEWSGYFTYRAAVCRQSATATDTTSIFNYQHSTSTTGIVISSTSSVAVSIIGIGY